MIARRISWTDELTTLLVHSCKTTLVVTAILRSNGHDPRRNPTTPCDYTHAVHAPLFAETPFELSLCDYYSRVRSGELLVSLVNPSFAHALNKHSLCFGYLFNVTPLYAIVSRKHLFDLYVSNHYAFSMSRKNAVKWFATNTAKLVKVHRPSNIRKLRDYVEKVVSEFIDEVNS